MIIERPKEVSPQNMAFKKGTVPKPSHTPKEFTFLEVCHNFVDIFYKNQFKFDKKQLVLIITNTVSDIQTNNLKNT